MSTARLLASLCLAWGGRGGGGGGGTRSTRACLMLGHNTNTAPFTAAVAAAVTATGNGAEDGGELPLAPTLINLHGGGSRRSRRSLCPSSALYTVFLRSSRWLPVLAVRGHCISMRMIMIRTGTELTRGVSSLHVLHRHILRSLQSTTKHSTQCAGSCTGHHDCPLWCRKRRVHRHAVRYTLYAAAIDVRLCSDDCSVVTGIS